MRRFPRASTVIPATGRTLTRWAAAFERWPVSHRPQEIPIVTSSDFDDESPTQPIPRETNADVVFGHAAIGPDRPTVRMRKLDRADTLVDDVSDGVPAPIEFADTADPATEARP